MTQTELTNAVAIPTAATIDINRLVEHAHEYQRASRSARTLKEYEGDWRSFVAFAEAHGESALPATPAVVALYATDCAGRHRPSTIKRRLAAIGVIHKLAGFEQPNRSAIVTDVVRGIARTHGTAPDRRKPLVVGDLKRMLKRLPDNRRGARDRAVLLVGIAGAFRRSELTSLDVEDVTFTDEGMIINLRGSKTDQMKEGVLVGVPFGSHDTTCPVRSLQRYIQVAGITHGALFRGIDTGDRVLPDRLSPQGVARLVKKACASIGLDVRRFSGHSLRSGFATTAAMNGCPTHAVARQGRWKSLNVVNGYIRYATIMQDNAAASLGL